MHVVCVRIYMYVMADFRYIPPRPFLRRHPSYWSIVGYLEPTLLRTCLARVSTNNWYMGVLVCAGYHLHTVVQYLCCPSRLRAPTCVAQFCIIAQGDKREHDSPRWTLTEYQLTSFHRCVFFCVCSATCTTLMMHAVVLASIGREEEWYNMSSSSVSCVDTHSRPLVTPSWIQHVVVVPSLSCSNTRTLSPLLPWLHSVRNDSPVCYLESVVNL